MIGKMSSSFYCGFEKQRELTLMNTMQVRKEALRIISKLNGACGERGVMGSVPGGRKHRLLSVPVPHRSSWLWKIVFVSVRGSIAGWFFGACITRVVVTTGSHGSFPLSACGPIEVALMCVWDAGYQVIPMTRRSGGFFAQPEHCQKLLLDVGPLDSCEG